MRFFLVTGIILTIVVCFISTGLAEELPDTDMSSVKFWEGTWTDVNYSLSLQQNGTEFSGIGRPYDIGLNDPFLLSGNISEDGNTFYGNITDSGTLIMNISDDKMSYFADATVNPIDNSSEPFPYTFKATRNGTSITPESIWSGEWNTANTTTMINQNKNSITGKYRPLSLTEYLGVLEGTVSEDGNTVSGTWSYRENITFTLADNGTSLIESDCGEKEKALGEVCLNLTKSL